MSSRSIKVLTFTALLWVWAASLLVSEASVHKYAGEKFGIKGNAFVVHGGSEGIYSSIPSQNQSSTSSNADSFIRYRFLIPFISPRMFAVCF